MITIKEVNSKALMLDHIKFPFKLYKDNPYWVPPLIQDELESFDKTKNPVFEHAEAHFYLAYKNNEIVGRIVAIINWQEVNQLQKGKVRFGWFDVIDDIEVTKALLEKVYELGRKHNLDHVEGPMGFSNLDKVGVLTEGFDELGTMITWYNHPYYAEHFEKLGFKIEKEYIENKFPYDPSHTETYEKAADLIKRRYNLRALTFKSSKEVMPYVDKMFDLFNESYSKLTSFVAISDIQKEHFKKKYIGLINPEYIKFVVDQNENMVGFAIVMPSFSRALQKANGKLFPFGFYHLLKARKNSKDAIFYLIGVHPDYQNKGAHSIIFDEYNKTFMKNRIEYCFNTPQLVENTAIQQIFKSMNPVIHCRRKTYKKSL